MWFVYCAEWMDEKGVSVEDFGQVGVRKHRRKT